MRAVIPFDAKTPKQRLSSVLDSDERAAFSLAMLRDVLDAMKPSRFEPTVISTAPLSDSLSVPIEIDERPLDAVVQDAIAAHTPLAVVMADLPLLTPDTLERLGKQEGDVVLAPGRGGGTNAILVRDTAFETDYHGASIRDHRRLARETGLSVAEIDSFRLGADIDEPADLLEVALHGEGRSAEWLESAGFRVETGHGRPEAVRHDESDAVESG